MQCVRFFWMGLLSLVWLTPLTGQTPTFRTWTNQKAQTVEAALKGIVEDKVKLRLRNGGEAEVVLNTLSAADQQRVANWQSKQTPSAPPPPSTTEGEGIYPGPAAGTVALDEKGGTTVIEEDSVHRVFRHESEHYEFICDSRIGVAAVREFSKVFEATWRGNCLLPLDLKQRPERLRTKFLAHIFTTQADDMAVGGIEGSAGVYMSGKKTLMLLLKSLGLKMVGSRVSINSDSEDYGTLVHGAEIEDAVRKGLRKVGVKLK